MNNNERWGLDAAEEADRAVAGGQAPGPAASAQIMGPLIAKLQCLAAAEAIERQVMPLTSMNPWNGG